MENKDNIKIYLNTLNNVNGSIKLAAKKYDIDFIVELLNKLKSFFNIFEAKWAKILASRRTTESTEEEGLGGNELSVDIETDSGIN